MVFTTQLFLAFCAPSYTVLETLCTMSSCLPFLSSTALIVTTIVEVMPRGWAVGISIPDRFRDPGILELKNVNPGIRSRDHTKLCLVVGESLVLICYVHVIFLMNMNDVHYNISMAYYN